MSASSPIIIPDFGETAKYKATTFNRTIYAFEHGSDISYQMLKEARWRSPVRSRWVNDVPREAFGDGFDLLDTEGKILEINAKWRSFADKTNFWKNLTRLDATGRAYGRVGVLIFNTGEIRAFEPDVIDYHFDDSVSESQDDTGNLPPTRPFAVTVREQFHMNTIFEVKHKRKLTHDPLVDDFFDVIFNEKEDTGQGASVMERIWDIAEGIDTITFMGTLLAGRYGHGAKVLTGPVADETEEEKMFDMLTKMDRNLKAILPEGWTFMDITPSGNINLMQLYEMLITDASAGTGMPKAYWMGDIPGQQSGADNNERQKFLVYQDVQNGNVPVSKRLLRFLAPKHIGIKLPEDFKLGWINKQELSEERQANLEKVSAETDILDAQMLTGNELRERRQLEKLSFFTGENEEIPLAVVMQKLASIINVMQEQEQEQNENGNDKDESSTTSNDTTGNGGSTASGSPSNGTNNGSQSDSEET